VHDNNTNNGTNNTGASSNKINDDNEEKKSGSSSQQNLSNSSKDTVVYTSNHDTDSTDSSGGKTKQYYYNEAWHIPSEELEILDTISSGSFGEVARARWRGSEVAVKVLKTPSTQVGTKVLNLFLKEVSILSKLRHPSIVLFMGASISPRLCIIMECLPKGSLYYLLHVQKEKLAFKEVIRIAKEISEGLNYLHLCSPKIIHRDIKSSNILVNEAKSIKIADFGISKETTTGSDGTMTGFMGTSSYMSPEMIQGTRYSEKVDVYSFGILLWELYTHKIPFKAMHPLQVAHKVLQGLRPTIPDKCPPELVKLLESCWHAEPAARPNFKDIIQILNSFSV